MIKSHLNNLNMWIRFRALLRNATAMKISTKAISTGVAPKHTLPNNANLQALEHRILFSSSPGGDIDVASSENLNDLVQSLHEASEPLILPDSTMDIVSGIDIPQPTRLILVDDTIEDINSLVDSLQDTFAHDAKIIRWSDANGSIDNLAKLLSEYDQIDELHVLSHGTDGAIAFGNEFLDASRLLLESQLVTAIRDTMSDEGDVLFYGCNVAASDAGKTYVSAFAELTATDVAASTNWTGNTEFGGNWSLEHRIGDFGAQLNLDLGDLRWNGLLIVPDSIVVTTTADEVDGTLTSAADLLANPGGSGISLREAILVANLFPNSSTITFSLGPTVQTIQLLSELPLIVRETTIDGAGLVELDGSLAGSGSNGLNFQLGSDNSEILGLIINRFDGDGVVVESDNAKFAGNIIGTDHLNTLGIGNHGNGVLISGDFNTLGLPTANGRNVISGNSLSGILIDGGANSTVQNNYIGVSITGDWALGNGSHGIELTANTQNVLIGGSGDGNVISGNGGSGIAVIGSLAKRNVIVGNFIGTDSTSTLDIGNQLSGIEFQFGARENTVGGLLVGDGNVIAFNQQNGITTSIDTNANSFLGNSIFANSGLGIDLGDDGVTVNDTEDLDSGANSLVNFPQILDLTYVGNDLRVTFRVDLPAANYRIEFFDNSLTPDASGFGEGKIFLGATTIAVAGSPGSETFTAVLPRVSGKTVLGVSATATVQLGPSQFSETSEFGNTLTKTYLKNTDEKLVNQFPARDQETSSQERGSHQAIAVAPSGDYVVAWSQLDPNSSQWNVYAQRFGFDGNKVGPVINVNVVTDEDQRWANIAMDATGRFAIVWTSHDQDGDNDGVYVRRFNANGTAIDTSDILVNYQQTNGNQNTPSISMNKTGEMVIAWQQDSGSNGVSAKLFDMDSLATGNRVNNPIITVDASADALNPSVDINDSGDFIVAWQNSDRPMVSKYNADGTQNGFAINVNPFNIFDQVEKFPVVALRNDGEFFVAYQSEIAPGVWLKHYRSNGTSYGFPVAVALGNDISAPSISMDDSGNLIVVYEGGSDGDGSGIFAKKYDSNGNNIGSSFQINNTSINDQSMASVAMLNTENFVVVWSGFGNQTGQVDSNGVFVRQFGTFVGPVPPPNQAPTITNQPPITIFEDSFHTLQIVDFGFNDADGDALASASIEQINNGRLFLNAMQVNVGDVISAADIASGKLAFVPNEQLSGNSANFTFRVSDGTDYSVALGTISFDVTADADQVQYSVGNRWEISEYGTIVNSTLLGNQFGQKVTTLKNGGYVVVWNSDDSYMADGDDGQSIFGQLFNAAGQKIGAEFEIAPLQTPDQSDVHVAGLADGGFVTAWVSGSPSSDLFIQRFDANGNFLNLIGTPSGVSVPTIASQYSAGNQFDVDVVGLANGFALTWASRDPAIIPDEAGIVARFFDLNGLASDEFRVNQVDAGTQRSPSIIALDDHRALVTWVNQNGDSYDIKGSILEYGNTTAGVEFLVNSETSSKQTNAKAASLGDNGFVITWQSENGDGSGNGIKARRFDLNGAPLDASDINVNVTTQSEQIAPDVIGFPDGSYTVFWQTGSVDGSGYGLLSRKFDAGTGQFGRESLVNNPHTGNQVSIDVAKLNNNEIVAVWENTYATNSNPDFRSEVIVGRLVQSTTGNEDTFLPLHLSSNQLDRDGSETINALTLTNLPMGSTLTDGVNSMTVSNASPINITSWNLSNISVKAPADFTGSLDVLISTLSQDGLDVRTSSEIVRLNFSPINDAIVKNSYSISTVSNSTITVASSQVVTDSNDPDHNTATPPMTTPALEYFVDTTTSGASNAFSEIEWISRTGGNSIYWNDENASLTSISQLVIGDIDRAFDLEGSNGGTLGLDSLNSNQYAFEIWFDPDNLSQTSVLFDWGSSDEGISLIQKGNTLRLAYAANQTILGVPVPTLELTASGILGNRFNQVVIVVDGNGGLAGDPGMADIAMFLNGQLVDIAADVPSLIPLSAASIASTSGSFEVTAGIADARGTFASTSGTASADEFDGQIARFAVFDTFVSMEEIANRYIEIQNAVDLVSINGTSVSGPSSIALPSGAKVNVLADGSFEYDPNSKFDYLSNGQTATDSFSYTVADQTGTPTIVNVAVNLSGTGNFLPDAIADNLGTVPAQNSTIINIADLLANDVDDNGDPITAIDFGRPSNGTLVDNGDGTLTYTPNAGFTGADSFQYTITDGSLAISHYWNLDNGGLDSVGGVNATIIGTTPHSSGTGLQFDEASKDYAVVSDFNYASSFTISFAFQIDDLSGNGYRYLYSHGDTGSTIRVYFREGSSPSTARNTLATVIRDGNDGTNINELDINALSLVGGWHTYTLVVDSGIGSKVYIDGVLQKSTSKGADGINPNTDLYIGAKSNLQDGRFMNGGISDIVIVDRAMGAVEIANFPTTLLNSSSVVSLVVNTPPAPVDDAYSTDEGTPFTGSVATNDTDADSDALTYARVSGPAQGSLVFNNDGTFSFDPNGQFEYLGVGETATVTFTYSATDTKGDSVEATATISVSGINDVPFVIDPATTWDYATNEDIALNGFGLLNNLGDIDGDVLGVRIIPVVAPSNGTIQLFNNGTFIYRPAANYFGSDSFVYRVFDGNGGKIDITAQINVLAVNDVPVFTNPSSFSVAENTSLVGFATVSDVDGGAPFFALAGSAPDNNKFTIDSVSGEIRFINPPNYFPFGDADGDGVYKVRVGVSDRNGGLATKLLSISVIDGSNSPVFAGPDSFYVAENTSPILITSAATDADGDLITYSLVQTGDWTSFSFNSTSRELKFVNSPNFEAPHDLNRDGNFDVTIRATDTSGRTGDHTVTISVLDVNEAPSLTNTGFNVFENSSAPILLTANDPDANETLTFQIADNSLDSALFQINKTTGELAFVSPPNFEQPSDTDLDNLYQVQIAVSDGVNTTTQIVSVSVGNVVEPGILHDDSFVVNEGQFHAGKVADLLANDQFFDDGALTFQIAVGPTNGTLVSNTNGTLRYTHSGSETSSDYFTYQVTEVSGAVSTATVFIVINPVDDAPVASTDSFLVVSNSKLSITLSDLFHNDYDVDSALQSVSIEQQPTIGKITMAPDGSLLFDSQGNVGTTSFTYRANSNGISSEATTVVVVIAASPAPPQPPAKDDAPPPNPNDGTNLNNPVPPTTPVVPKSNANNADVGGYSETNAFADSFADDIGRATEIDEGESESDFVSKQANSPTYGNRVSRSDSFGSSLIVDSNQKLMTSTDQTEWLSDYYQYLDGTRANALVNFDYLSPTSTSVVAGLISVGYLTWMIRGGVLLTTFMSSLPAWQSFDPLPIVEHMSREKDNEEAIEDMVESK